MSSVPDDPQPTTMQVHCSQCNRTFDIRKSNKPESKACPKCKIYGTLSAV